LATAERKSIDIIDHRQRIGICLSPTGPGRDPGREKEELDPSVLALNGPAPWLGPDRVRLVVKPCHGAHKQPAIVPERVGDPVDSPVVHETGVADRSPGDEYGNASQLVVHHLPKAQHGDRVCLSLPLD